MFPGDLPYVFLSRCGPDGRDPTVFLRGSSFSRHQGKGVGLSTFQGGMIFTQFVCVFHRQTTVVQRRGAEKLCVLSATAGITSSPGVLHQECRIWNQWALVSINHRYK